MYGLDLEGWSREGGLVFGYDWRRRENDGRLRFTPYAYVRLMTTASLIAHSAFESYFMFDDLLEIGWFYLLLFCTIIPMATLFAAFSFCKSLDCSDASFIYAVLLAKSFRSQNALEFFRHCVTDLRRLG